MKTNWKNKLKTVLAETATAEKSEIYLETPLTKTDKTPLDIVSSVFVSGELTDISEKQSFQIKDLTDCPVCSATAKVEQSEALRVTFCLFGCSFLVCRFTENKEAVEKAIAQMCEAMTDDELEAKADALDERTAVFMLENGWTAETAARAAYNDILPAMLDKFEQRVKFGSSALEN